MKREAVIRPHKISAEHEGSTFKSRTVLIKSSWKLGHLNKAELSFLTLNIILKIKQVFY